MYKILPSENYKYKNLPIYGGGFVTGILFHPNAEHRLYIRTDIGGVYRYNFGTEEWETLCAHVKAIDTSETYPLAIAVDSEDKDSLFMVCGDKKNAYLCISHDCGNSFVRNNVPCTVHGNEVGRGSGERLLYRSGRIYFGSMSEGILITGDMGKSWDNRTVNGEKNISCLWISEDESLVIAGCSGEINSPDGHTRGAVLYYSTDKCESFHILTYPDAENFGEATYQGFVPQRIAFDGRYLYITFNHPAKIFYGGWGSYSCDSGSSLDGRIYKYEIKNGVPFFVKDITPENSLQCGGFGGICCAHGILAAATICRSGGDIIYRSYDGGEHWEKILHDLDIGKVEWNVSYMKPEYSGGHSCIHWMSDFKISTHDADLALFNTGTGVFCTKNLTHNEVMFRPLCTGIEETVHLNVYSPPAGKVRVIDIVGDLGGFAFEDIDKPCENSFADEKGDRYITCLNADYTLKDPEYVVATPRGNWTGKTKGGLIVSHDCKNWKHLNFPLGITPEIDRAVDGICQPNADSGWASLSADGKRITWAMTRAFSSRMTVYTDDEGEHWHRSVFLDADGKEISREMCVRVFSDLYDENCAFGISDDFRLFVSFDKSESFKETDTGLKLSRIPFNRFQLSRQTDRPYTFWLADGRGLYRYEFFKDGTARAENVLCNNDFAKTVGFGKGGGDIPAMYCTGVIGGEYGFYRSDDLGESFIRINDDGHNFGDIIAVCGDGREHGRFYLATGTLGLITGAPE